ncbi:MAG: antitoxin MazE family protein [Proteobacteria bacterium]|nr:antitoxin MazE family protein [Pseudomonadota bacterium]MBI3498190.1 antitoxin MazE family protein [Pseudomonadota bacterium]
MASERRRARGRTRQASRDKARAHRESLRAQGLRPVQFWVLDTRSPKFAAEARRQCRLIAKSPHSAADQAFVDAISQIRFE